MRTGAKYAPPTNEIEEKLVTLWQELLKKEKIGTHDNFFHLGGHSLKVMNLVAQIHKTFGVEIPMREIFDKPFVADIAKLIRDKDEKRKKLEQILQEIEGLSDEQVLELLG
jgi:acyl carrier protein